MRAAANERVYLRLEIHADGTLIATTSATHLDNNCESEIETPEQVRKLI
jgi:hypothetical protein